MSFSTVLFFAFLIVGLVVFFICRPKNNDSPSPNINNDVDYGIKTGDTFEIGTYNNEKIAIKSQISIDILRNTGL